MEKQGLTVSTLESWLWDAACQIRGPLDAPKFKDYILPLVFLKRLSDVFVDEVRHLAHDFGDVATARSSSSRTTNLFGSTCPRLPPTSRGKLDNHECRELRHLLRIL